MDDKHGARQQSGPGHDRSARDARGGRSANWPAWRDDYPTTAPGGEPYLLATLRMTVPAGRYWQQHRLVENDRLHQRLGPLLGTLPMNHSLLQEPHGGQPCRYTDRALSMRTESDPDRWPNTLFRQHALADGPRLGLGEVTLTLRLQTRAGDVHEVSRTVNECNIRADGRLLLTQIPPGRRS
ncbi:hypothetical protein [Streptomyces sp. NPDC059176]|uniref:hypothetical protein n=1 Tax=unclassified Streptomyces TaxID=2593676 RepID=UPI00368903FA